MAPSLNPFTRFSEWRQRRRRQPPKPDRVPRKRVQWMLRTSGMALQMLIPIAIIITISALHAKSVAENGVATVNQEAQAWFDPSTGAFHAAPLLGSSIVWASVPAWIVAVYTAYWSSMVDELKKYHVTLEIYKSRVAPFPGSGLWAKMRLSRPFPFFKRSSTINPLPVTSPSSSPPLPPPPTRLATAASSSAPTATTTTTNASSQGPTLRPGTSASASASTSPQGPAASMVKRTILLDHGGVPLWNAYKAFRFGHNILGLCLLIRAALWIGGGLAASIFAVATVPREVPAEFAIDTFFEEYLGWEELNRGSSMASQIPALDVVSATVVNKAANYPWTTETHAFLPFRPQKGGAFGANNANSGSTTTYTAPTEAYWAIGDCLVAGQADLDRINAVQIDSPDAFNNYTMAHVHFSHAGCTVDKSFNFGASSTLYGRAWTVTNCGDGYSNARVGVISGSYSATAKYLLANLTVVSCIPVMYRSNVLATVAVTPGDASAVQVLNFTELNRQRIWPEFARGWLSDMPFYDVRDPTLDLDVDTFASLVVTHAAGRDERDVHRNITAVEAARVGQSFQTIFQAFFASYVALEAFFPTNGAPLAVQGSIARDETRLFVVAGAAFAVVGIVAAALLTTTALAVYLHLNKEILEKHMPHMLGVALLFQESVGTAEYIEELKRAVEGKGAVIEESDLVGFAQKDPGLSEWSVWADDADVLHIEPKSTSTAVLPGSPAQQTTAGLALGGAGPTGGGGGGWQSHGHGSAQTSPTLPTAGPGGSSLSLAVAGVAGSPVSPTAAGPPSPAVAMGHQRSPLSSVAVPSPPISPAGGQAFELQPIATPASAGGQAVRHHG